MYTEQLFKLFRSSSGVSTDTRTLQPGALFFALSGPAFDGNQYASLALEKGAIAAVVTKTSGIVGNRILPVEDPLEALQQLATYYRSTWKCPVLAIGGSNGKTTTKELVSAVLSTGYETFATPGNLNNHIGVPLSILMVDSSKHAMVVLELGANHPGEIEQLCTIAQPTHGYITNIGMDHLEGFGSLAGVLHANAELFRYLQAQGGTVFINTLQKDLAEHAQSIKRKVTFPAPQDECPIRSMETQRKNVLSWGDRSPITSPLPGKHNFENLAAALAIGLHFGVPYERIGKALETYKPTNNRSQILDLHNGITVWLDAYNANPSSMAAALESAAAFAGDRPLVCFLGDMLELGDFSESAHFELCKMLESYSPHMVFLVGSCFYRNRDIFPSFRFLESISDLNPTFLHTIPAHAVVLFKGSRGLRMERIAQILQEAE